MACVSEQSKQNGAKSTTKKPDADDAWAILRANLKDHDPKVYEGLRINLGLPRWLLCGLVTNEPTLAKKISTFLTMILQPIELLIHKLIPLLPPHVMNKLMLVSFAIVVKIWGSLPKCVRCRGCGDGMSTEAHFMSVLMFFPRLMWPITVARARVMLAGLEFMHPLDKGIKEEVIDVPDAGVKGIWLHTAPEGAEDPPVVYWFFGGALVAGDCRGNRGIATKYAKALGADVFLPDYRLLPEGKVEDQVLDGCRSYEWLCSKKAGSKIYAAGVSAGCGVLLRALQYAASTDPKERAWAFHGTGPTPQPVGAVLLGPFVDYTIPQHDAWVVKMCAVDWLVSQTMLATCGDAVIKGAGGSQARLKWASPLFYSVRGLCPMFISYSNHEVMQGQSRELKKRLQEVGVPCEVHEVDFVGHAYQVQAPILPEGKKAELAAISWFQRQQQALLAAGKK